MSNDTCRSYGMAKRALALFMAFVLAITLTPGFALADESSADSGGLAGQDTPAGSSDAASTLVDAGAAGVDTSAGSSASDAEGGAVGSVAEQDGASSLDAEAAGKAPVQSTGSVEVIDGASSTEADTVSATLKISVYGTALVSQVFEIEKGKTVEDMLDMAVERGCITSYSHGSPYPGYTAYYVDSITVNGIAYTQPVDYAEYWSSAINGAWESDGINGTTIEYDGFSYELNYVSNDPSASFEDYPTSPNAPHPDKVTGGDTISYVKNDGNTSAVTSAPTSSDNAVLSWKKTYGNGNYSEVLTLGDSVYFASSLFNADWTAQPAVLHRLNSKGEEISSLQLFGAIDSSACRMAYTDGVIIIPLSNGRLQGVSATEMKTLWVSGIIASGAQSVSTVTTSGGMVFTGTANSLDVNYNAATGTFFCINAITGERVWAKEEANTGFYWSGACKVGSVLLYGNDAGTLTAVDPATGATVSTLKLSSAIRSTVISNRAETEAYVTTNDGTLHKIAVAPDGVLSESGTASFASKSTGTATLFRGNLFVGGCAADYSGTLSVIDAASMEVKRSISLPFEVKSAPLVAKGADGNTYAYFTCNGAEGVWPDYTSGGGAWVYCLETDTAAKLFDASGSEANWCTKSIVMGADGTLYWTNDSGTLFALASAASSSNGTGASPETGAPAVGDEQNGSSSDGGAGGRDFALMSASAGVATVAAQAPLNSAESSAGSETADEEGGGVPVSSASSAHGVSAAGSSDPKGIPWLPFAGIAVGCAGLVAVGLFVFRRRFL